MIGSDGIVGNRTGKTHIIFLNACLHPVFPCENFFTLWGCYGIPIAKEIR
jgi:hypothetical protein